MGETNKEGEYAVMHLISDVLSSTLMENFAKRTSKTSIKRIKIDSEMENKSNTSQYLV